MKEEHIKQMREFNRFYTNIDGLLNQHLLNSPFSLPEARVLYEIVQHEPCTASDIMSLLSIDRGYMSRILTNFASKGIISKKKSKADGRAYFLHLTRKGKKA